MDSLTQQDYYVRLKGSGGADLGFPQRSSAAFSPFVEMDPRNQEKTQRSH